MNAEVGLGAHDQNSRRLSVKIKARCETYHACRHPNACAGLVEFA